MTDGPQQMPRRIACCEGCNALDAAARRQVIAVLVGKPLQRGQQQPSRFRACHELDLGYACAIVNASRL